MRQKNCKKLRGEKSIYRAAVENLFKLWFSAIMFAFSFPQMMPILFTFDMLMRESCWARERFFMFTLKSHTNNENSYCKFSNIMEFKFEKKCKYFFGFALSLNPEFLLFHKSYLKNKKLNLISILIWGDDDDVVNVCEWRWSFIKNLFSVSFSICASPFLSKKKKSLVFLTLRRSTAAKITFICNIISTYTHYFRLHRENFSHISSSSIYAFYLNSFHNFSSSRAWNEWSSTQTSISIHHRHNRIIILSFFFIFFQWKNWHPYLRHI